MNKQPWIYSSSLDSAFILAPPFICLLVIFLFPSLFTNTGGMSTISWVSLVLLIDVAHVYSTLFRTYFDKEVFQTQRTIFMTIPFVSFIAGVVLYSIDGMLFWRLLAYLAVFHFIRQQYGFMRIYSRNENQPAYGRFMDMFTVYTVTVYPIVYWHLHAPRNFNWFLEGDFYYFQAGWMDMVSIAIYIVVLLIYIIKEIRLIIQTKKVNIPRNILILGTALSWYFGIVYFNGDLAFTLLNVVSHGVPYMALVWMYGKKKAVKGGYQNNRVMRRIYAPYGIIVFVLTIVVLAYFEEGLWDGFVWKEHLSVFKAFASLPALHDQGLLAFVIPLLSLPQITHYVIDGYIWKLRNDTSGWKKIVME